MIYQVNAKDTISHSWRWPQQQQHPMRLQLRGQFVQSGATERETGSCKSVIQQNYKVQRLRRAKSLREELSCEQCTSWNHTRDGLCRGMRRLRKCSSDAIRMSCLGIFCWIDDVRPLFSSRTSSRGWIRICSIEDKKAGNGQRDSSPKTWTKNGYESNARWSHRFGTGYCSAQSSMG
jgi:hypothetical protein